MNPTEAAADPAGPTDPVAPAAEAEQPAAPPLLDMARLRSRGFLLGAAVRMAVMTALAAGGFVGLALIHDAERASRQRIQVSEESLGYALSAGVQCVPPMACLALMLECYLPIMAYLRLGWAWRGTALPLGWGGVFAIVAAWVFRVDEADSFGKQVMLVSGGFLCGMLTASLQAVWWNMSSRVADDPTDFPPVWSAVMLLAIVAFLGGQRAFTDVRPVMRRIQLHRDRAWAPGAPHAEPRDAPPEGII